MYIPHSAKKFPPKTDDDTNLHILEPVLEISIASVGHRVRKTIIYVVIKLFKHAWACNASLKVLIGLRDKKVSRIKLYFRYFQYLGLSGYYKLNLPVGLPEKGYSNSLRLI